MQSEPVPVLDKGYVRLADYMGSDLSVVNAARASYMKESSELSDKDKQLLQFLVRNGHMSPFRHATMTFEIKAPLMVARQWWTYVVGSDHTMEGFNEASRRYVTMEPEFYVPEQWRSKPDDSKQGSGGPVPEKQQVMMRYMYDSTLSGTMASYQIALAQGVAPEQARLFLPMYALYTVWRWTASLQSVAHFLNERLDAHAQWEIRQYAAAVRRLAEPLYPQSFAALGVGK